jgi:predicted AlkP superfamily phosphohydrolase/phosphomutase
MQKVIVVGLDGATFNVLNPMIEKGILPNLAELIQSGVSGELESTIPPVTAPAWSSFMTGKNPGKHGLFDWRKPFDANHHRAIISGRDIKARKLWHIIGDHGEKVGIVNVPLTYPPDEVNGYLVSGLLTPELGLDPETDFTYPPELKQQLKEAVGEYVIDVDVVFRRMHTGQDIDKFLDDLKEAILKRDALVDYLLSLERFDFFMVVFVTPDRIQHWLWDYASNHAPTTDVDRAEFERRRDKVWECYQVLDEVLGRLLKRTNKDTRVFVLSDHGFGPLQSVIHLNDWLAAAGFLRYKTSRRIADLVRSLVSPFKNLVPGAIRVKGQAAVTSGTIDWKQTRAYSGSPSEHGVFINVQGREPCGVVPGGREYEDLRRLIRERLVELTDSKGRPIFKVVHLREDVYDGPYVHAAPDIVLELNDGYMITPNLSPGEIISDKSQFGWGWHTRDGILIARGEGIRPQGQIDGASIIDLAPTILYAMDLPIPEDMDGKVLTELFLPSYLEKNPPQYQSVGEEDLLEVDRSEKIFSTEDETLIQDRLRKLGYID